MCAGPGEERFWKVLQMSDFQRGPTAVKSVMSKTPEQTLKLIGHILSYSRELEGADVCRGERVGGRCDDRVGIGGEGLLWVEE